MYDVILLQQYISNMAAITSVKLLTE